MNKNHKYFKDSFLANYSEAKQKKIAVVYRPVASQRHGNKQRDNSRCYATAR
jgi:hypothetical protein